MTIEGGNVRMSNATSTYSGGTTVNAGTLIIGDGVTIGAAGGELTLNGTGSYIREGSGTFTGPLTLGRRNSLTVGAGGVAALPAGVSSVNIGGGSTLTLNAAGAVPDTAGIYVKSGGGALSVLSSESVEKLYSQEPGQLNVTTGGGATLTFSALDAARAAGSTVNFGGTSQVVFTAAPAPVNGIIGGFATMDSNWAAMSGNQVAAYAHTLAETDVAPATWANTMNVLLTAAESFQTVSPSVTVNSLKLAASVPGGEGSGVIMGIDNGVTLTVGTGGIISAGVSDNTIGGIGTLATAGDIIFRTVGTGGQGDLTVSAGLNVNGLTKTGAAKLTLTSTALGLGATGPITVAEGELSFSTGIDVALGNPIAGQGRITYNPGTTLLPGNTGVFRLFNSTAGEPGVATLNKGFSGTWKMIGGKLFADYQTEANQGASTIRATTYNFLGDSGANGAVVILDDTIRDWTGIIGVRGAELAFRWSRNRNNSSADLAYQKIQSIGVNTLTADFYNTAYTGGTGEAQTQNWLGTVEVYNQPEPAAQLLPGRLNLRQVNSAGSTKNKTWNLAGGVVIDRSTTINVSNTREDYATALNDEGFYTEIQTGVRKAAGATGTVVLTKDGSGQLGIRGTSTYDGGTIIAGGVLNVAADVNLGTAGTPISIGAGTLQYGAAFNMDARTVTLTNAASAIDTGTNAVAMGSMLTALLAG